MMMSNVNKLKAHLEGAFVEELTEGGAKGKPAVENQAMALSKVMYGQKRKVVQGRGLARQRGVWYRMNTNSLAVSTNEISKIRSSWEEGSSPWCDGRSVKELKCLRENEVKISMCLYAETGC
ncbi:hypothetical protein DUI87_16584 [Hirundo rustica rustica]|uniref:Uncharacterized protein n=1 Tax=Hirundo rustica rustica TaxID=333673 RepID=A0A3M0K2C0_HIRRU|nr:hypothetical protein DUI87_16584 [Hirundo rustica rustica]